MEIGLFLACLCPFALLHTSLQQPLSGPPAFKEECKEGEWWSEEILRTRATLLNNIESRSFEKWISSTSMPVQEAGGGSSALLNERS